MADNGAGTWANHPPRYKAAFIRFVFADPYRLTTPRDQILNFGAGIFAANGGNATFGHNLGANEHPSQDELLNFKRDMILFLREYVDGVGFTIKQSVSDEALSRLAGNERLNGIASGDFGGAATFIQSAGTGSIAGDTRETGVDRGIFERTKLEDAILRPDQYIQRANLDLKNIDEQSLDVYRRSFRKYYEDYKYSAEEAKKRAMADKDTYYNMLKKQHDEVFKADLFKQAKKRIVRNMGA